MRKWDKYACTTGKPKSPGDGQQRLIKLIAAIVIVREEGIRHPNAISGCLETVRAGHMDDLRAFSFFLQLQSECRIGGIRDVCR